MQTYPEFIRALGGTAQARVAEPSATVRALRGIDFGTLDDPIERLERRLATPNQFRPSVGFLLL